MVQENLIIQKVTSQVEFLDFYFGDSSVGKIKFFKNDESQNECDK